MKIRATIHDTRWRYLAAALDARMLLFVFFAGLLAFPFFNIPGNNFLDRSLFKLGIKLQSQTMDASGYVRVDVPADEMQRFLRDPVSATAMIAFLEQLQSSHMRGAKLVLHEKLWTDYRMNAVLEHANPVGVAISPEALRALNDMKRLINVFQSFLTDRRIAQVYIERDAVPSTMLFPVLPFFSIINSDVLPEKSRYTLSQLSGQGALRVLQDKMVIIGEQNDLAADDLLLNAISVENSSVANFSPWFFQFHAAVMTFFLVYLLLLPFMPLKVSAVLSLLFVLALVLTQQLFLILHREWFSIFQCLLFLVAGHVMVLLWCIRRSFYGGTESSLVAPVGVFSFAKKKNPVRVQPTMMGDSEIFGSGTESYEDTVVLQKTRSRAVSSPAQKSVRQHLGRYRIERELGRGAMGVVYLGFDPKISRKVAIKTLHYNQFNPGELPAVKERFFREAAAAGKLRHPNIVTIYDAGEESDLAYIAMDYVEGDSLAAHIRKDQLLDVEQVYYIMAMVALAVHEANSQDVIHRDIKPSNILYDSKNNVVKVADFGIARIMDGSATRTQAGELIGSPLYMSPEQIKGERVSSQSDIFSLGVTFYQLLTGELPFKGDSLANLSYQIVQCKFKPVNEVRAGLPDSARRIIAKALQQKPDNRYKTAADMYDDLHRAYSRDFG